MKPIIKVENLSKEYHIGARTAPYATLRDSITQTMRAPLARLRSGRRNSKESFLALKDVNFQIRPGEVVGVIGRNGAGKSTLLKVLSRITEPTTGKVDLWGRVSSLLEVGTGFHPELTGRENIYLNGAILGMQRTEIQRKFDEIVAFAEVEKFLETPVKHYSSGMYTRLAFAVAAHLEPEILLVDEVLAVGDAAFQKKCLSKMGAVAKQGRTVLFVSHNMHAVALLCGRCILLKNGSVAYIGEAQSAINDYLSGAEEMLERDASINRPGTGEYRFSFISPEKAVFDANEEKKFRYRIERRTTGSFKAYLSAHIVNEFGAVIAQCDSRLVAHWIDGREVAEGEFVCSSPWLKPGSYRLDVFICGIGTIVDHYENACAFDVSPVIPYPQSVSADGVQSGLVLADFNWKSNHE